MLIDQERLSQVTALALLHGTSAAEQIRRGAEWYVDLRRRDPNLRDRVEQAVERFRNDLKTLLPSAHRAVESPASRATAPAQAARDEKAERRVTLRLSNRVIGDLTSLALLDGTTLAEQLRQAVDRYLANQTDDTQKLAHQIDEAQQQQQQLLNALPGAK